MVAASQQGSLWSVDEYLRMERYSTIKHEFHDGYVYAMSGGTQAHNIIALNMAAFIRAVVRGGACRVFTSDIKVRQSPGDYVYPDVAVSCDPRDDVPERDWIEHPVLIVEVPSRSTEKHDRGDKFEGYEALASLQDYVLVEYKQKAVEVWRRDDAGQWTMTSYGPGQDVSLQSVSATMSLDRIYEDSGA